MNHTHDRRAPGTARIPFDAMVEVGGTLGPTFEAQAINLSEQGMSLRTAYLPEEGQPVVCRFDAGEGTSVTAAGEVLWNQPTEDGGAFGIRFTNLDATSTVALHRILGMVESGQMVMDPGRKVRLHIEGLAAPMRARIKAQGETSVTAYSDLGFLQMGRPLELEDAASGARRPALIDRVEVEVDAASRVPQLIVSLRYEDAPMDVETSGALDTPSEAALPSPNDDEDALAEDADAAVSTHDAPVAPSAAVASEDDEGDRLKSSFARNAAKVTPALLAWMKRARVTASLLAARAARRGRGATDVDVQPRRTTAPAPGGGLHASGRKVVRGSGPSAPVDSAATTATKGGLVITKKRAATAGAVGVAALLVFLAVRSPTPSPEPAATAAADPSAQTMPAAVITALPPAEPAPAPEPIAAAPSIVKPARPAPFTNGNVGSRPTVLRIKMDGPIERILGASQPTGFTVVIPNRKSTEATDDLIDKDPRLADIESIDDPSGAELNVSFKDGVPNYIVRARGDVLEVLLARANSHGNKAPEAKAKPAPNKKRERTTRETKRR